MRRLMLTYGVTAGGIVIGVIILSMTVLGTDHAGSEWLGYLVMLLALSLIFLGIKRYRDEELGGVIRFGTGVAVGLGITLVASLIYVVAWEVYLASTDYTFMDVYTRSVIAAHEAEGMTGEALQAETESLARMQEMYSNPLFRLPMTMMEIFPVGLLITLASAGLLRNPDILPAQG